MMTVRPYLSLLLALGLLLLAPGAYAQTVVEEIGQDGGPGEDGEAAHGGGVEIRPGGEPVDLEVLVRGGNGGPGTPEGAPAGNGGDASLGAVYGKSETGDVEVAGEAWAGRGGARAEGPSAGDGGKAHLRNAVDGDTQGALRLDQRAIGGAGGVGTGGSGGAASSHLSRSKSVESFELHAQANGGGRAVFFDGDRFVDNDFGGPGAPAAASGRATNDAGPVRAFTVAVGGGGGVTAVGGPAAPGGDAKAWASAATRGDGHPVLVGEPFPEPDAGTIQVITAAAVGGTGGSFRVIRGTLGGSDPSDYADTPNVPGGDGGNASSLSMGVARGRSPVEVYDVAIGGTGGRQLATFTPLAGPAPNELYIDVGAGTGGEARSVAIALGGRGEPVRAFANASGGAASNIFEVSPTSLDPEQGGLSNTFVRTVGERVAPEGGISNTFTRNEGGPSNQFGRRTFRLQGDFGASGGPAHAKAQAFGSGPVDVEALADGGGGSIWLGNVPRSRHTGGPAYAVASGSGKGGMAAARAGSNSPTTNVKVGAASELLYSASAEAKVGEKALDVPKPSGRRGWRRHFQRKDAVARAIMDPSREASDAALAHAPDGIPALDEPGRPALGRWTTHQNQWSWRDSVTTTLTLELRTERNVFDDPIETYRVLLFSPKLSRWGFESLRVTLEKEGEVLSDESFSDAAEAEAYLDGQLLEVGTIGGVELPSPFFTGAVPAETAGLVISTPEAPDIGEGPGSEVIELPPFVEIFRPRRSEVAVLTLELETRRPGAGLELDFLVSTTPVASAP